MIDPCPKCGYESELAGVSTTECARCGIVFSKWRTVPEPVARDPWPATPVEEDVEERGLVAGTLAAIVTPRVVTTVEFAGHAIVYLVIFIWGWRFILMDMHSNEIGSSFMHLIDLVFHEAGHVLFMPFGRFMMILGGSLLQLLVPLSVAAVFLVKNRDPFGASIGVWWLGQSFKDLAPYINDARALSLPLLGGITGFENPDVHDWRNILSSLGILHFDHVVAWWSDRIGTTLLLVAMAWGAWTLYREYRTRDDEQI